MNVETLQLLLGPGALVVGVLYAIWTGRRGDWIFRGNHEQIIAGKDAVIAEVRAQLVNERERADRYEEKTIRLLEAAKEASSIATEAVVKRGSHE